MHHWVDPAGDASSPLLRTSRSLLKIDSEIRYPQGWSPEKLLIHRGKNWWSRRDLNPNKSPGNLSFSARNVSGSGSFGTVCPTWGKPRWSSMQGFNSMRRDGYGVSCQRRFNSDPAVHSPK